jgi:hypothetical protein
MNINYTKSTQQIFDNIEQYGYSTMEHAVDANTLEELQEYITTLKSVNHGSFAVVGHELLAGSLIGELYKDDLFLKMQAELVSKKLDYKIQPSESKYQVLRVLNGGNVNSQSHLFHFDNYTLTTLIPIFIPNNIDNKNGDLLVLPNIRNICSSPTKDALIKIITQNPISRKLLKISLIRRFFNFQSIKLKPGNMYFFWGFSSYHGNDDCNEGSLRSTALFHFHKTVKTKNAFTKFTSTKKRSRVKI